MQNYNSFQDQIGQSTNTSAELVSIDTPSQEAIRNIKAFARCIQRVKAGKAKIKVSLN